jgi:hypothetical protein
MQTTSQKTFSNTKLGLRNSSLVETPYIPVGERQFAGQSRNAETKRALTRKSLKTPVRL